MDRDRAPRRGAVPRLGDHHDRRRELQRRGRPRHAPSSACAGSSTSRCSGDPSALARSTRSAPASSRRSPTASGSASRLTRPTPRPAAVYGRAPRRGLPVDDASRRERGGGAHGCVHGERADGELRPHLPPPLGETGIRALARAGAARPAARRRALRHRRLGGDRAARASTTSRSRTALARTRCSAAGSRRSASSARPGSASASAPTAPPRRRPSTCSPSCGPPSSRRAPASAAPTRSPRPRPWSSRRSARRARSGSTTRSARWFPANTPTSPSSHSMHRPTSRGRIPPRPSSSEARRSP